MTREDEVIIIGQAYQRLRSARRHTPCLKRRYGVRRSLGEDGHGHSTETIYINSTGHFTIEGQPRDRRPLRLVIESN